MTKLFISFFMGVAVGCVFMHLRFDYMLVEIEQAAAEMYEQRLADPHHCVSICVEQFEKMGC